MNSKNAETLYLALGLLNMDLKLTYFKSSTFEAL